MFNFLKKKMSLDDVASMMAKMAFLHLTKPSEEDIRFHAEAVDDSVDSAWFLFEVLSLLSFTTTAVVNRERLEGKLTQSQAERLIPMILDFVHKNLLSVGHIGVFPAGVAGDVAFDLLVERVDAYCEPAWGPASVDDTAAQVAALFAAFCGAPESEKVKAIGWSLLVVRGNAIGQWLSRFRLDP